MQNPFQQMSKIPAGAILIMAASSSFALAETDINVGVIRLTSQTPTFIAYEKGYFEEEGLNVELKFFEASNALSVAVAGGDVNYGTTSITGSLFNLAEKGVVKVIAGSLTEAPDVPGAVILASKKAYDAGLTEPSKLAGHSFGATSAGSSFHYMMSQIAAKEGIDIENVQLKPLQKIGAIIGALSTGQIDAWVIQPSIGNKLLADGNAVKIGEYNTYDPNYQVTAAFTSTEIAENDRETTEAYLRALTKATADYNAAFIDKTASEEEVRELAGMVHEYVSTDVPAEDFVRTMSEDSMRISEGLALSVASIQTQLDFLQDNGPVPKSITTDMLIDSSYVETP